MPERPATDRSDRRIPRRTAWFALCALLFFQASYAAHQFQHAADDVAQPCRICLQNERLDDIPAPTAVLQVALQAQPIVNENSLDLLRPVPVRASQPRGPPLS